MHAKLPPKLNTLIFSTKKSAEMPGFFLQKRDEILKRQRTIQVMLINFGQIMQQTRRGWLIFLDERTTRMTSTR